MRTFRFYVYALALIANLVFATSSRASVAVQCSELFQVELDLEKYVRSSVIDIDGRSVYLERFDAKPGFGTAVVFMGLFVPISDLHAFQREFIRKSKGEGLLIFTYSTQTESLIWRAYSQKKKLTDPTVDMADLVREATAAVNAAQVSGPVTAVGYSFGSAPATRFAIFHKGRVNNLVLAGPLIEAGDQSDQTLNAKHTFESMASFNPFFGATLLADARDRAAQSTAESIVDGYLERQKFPRKVRRAAVVAAVKAQIRSAETFDLAAEVNADWPATTFIVGDKESPTRFRLQKSVVEKLEKEGVAVRLTVIENSPHPVLAAKPRESVDAVLSVMRTGKP